MAVLRSYRRRLIVWPTYLCTLRHHWASLTSGCKLQRPITNWQIDFVSVLYINSVSLSTNFTLGKTFPVTTALTVLWSPDPGIILCCTHHTLAGALLCRSACRGSDRLVLIVVVVLLLVPTLTDGFDWVAVGIEGLSKDHFLLPRWLMVQWDGVMMFGTGVETPTFVLARSQNRRLETIAQAGSKYIGLLYSNYYPIEASTYDTSLSNSRWSSWKMSGSIFDASALYCTIHSSWCLFFSSTTTCYEMYESNDDLFFGGHSLSLPFLEL